MLKFLSLITIICLAGRVTVHSKNVPCNGDKCGKSSMPILDNVRAPLYAELDTDSLNKQLKKYIDTNVEVEVEETLENKTEQTIDMKLEELTKVIDKNITAFTKDFNVFKKHMIDLTSTLNKKLEEVIGTQRNVTKQYKGDRLARDCRELVPPMDGVYLIQPKNYSTPVKVYCETKTDGGGWTVLQRRFDGSVSFNRKWDEYEKGFGKVTGEHWLGNKLIHSLTSQGNNELRVDLEDWNKSQRYASYSVFSIGDAESKYSLTIGGYNGSAGDSLEYHNSQKFSTMDQDNDMRTSESCAEKSLGAWWYKNCYHSNLNGIYNETSLWTSMSWRGWHGDSYSFKSTRMMIR